MLAAGGLPVRLLCHQPQHAAGAGLGPLPGHCLRPRPGRPYCPTQAEIATAASVSIGQLQSLMMFHLFVPVWCLLFCSVFKKDTGITTSVCPLFFFSSSFFGVCVWGGGGGGDYSTFYIYIGSNVGLIYVCTVIIYLSPYIYFIFNEGYMYLS